jgi:glycosyltransferase involved in cell wall biosynthesis
VRLLVYGSNLPEALKPLAAEDVILKGFVRTTEEVYDSARVFIAPLLSGAGLKGKVIGAFARGIPTVMTPIAAEGTGASNGLHAAVVSTPQDWAQAIARLYNDAGAWQAMSEQCRALTREANSFARGQEMMRQALQSAGIFATPQNQALCSQFPVH